MISLYKIGHRIKIARHNRRFTQVELAKHIGFTQKGLSRIENGKSELTIKTLCKIAKALKLPPSFFLEEKVNTYEK